MEYEHGGHQGMALLVDSPTLGALNACDQTVEVQTRKLAGDTGGPADFGILVEVTHPLAHRKQRHDPTAISPGPSANPELAGLMDDRFEPQNIAMQVVQRPLGCGRGLPWAGELLGSEEIRRTG